MKALILLILGLLVPLFSSASTYLVIGAEQTWQGEVRVSQPLLVAAGARLIVQPGTRVKVESPEAEIKVEGTLQVLGSASQPVSFDAPAGWVGIRLTQTMGDNRIEFTEFRAAKSAISSTLSRFRISHTEFADCDTAIKLHRQSQLSVDNTTFSQNRIAIDVEMRSQISVRSSRFEQNETALLASLNSSGEILDNRFLKNQLAIQVKHLFPGRIAQNRFDDNDQGVLCDQTMQSPEIFANSFSHNRQAIISLLASKPVIRQNRFLANQQALFNNQLGSPVVQQNLFAENDIAIRSERRSAPQVERNSFENNLLALHCDYLAYPAVRKNNFRANRMAVKLGEHQSADMERQGVSQEGVEQFLTESGRQGKMAIFTPASGIIDVRDNWWGTAISADEAESLFFDRSQAKWVVDDNSGVRYLRDQVVYEPWLEKPVNQAGPVQPL